LSNQRIVKTLNEDDIVYFLHIPKTAGNSFMDIINNFFDYDKICKLYGWNEFFEKPPKNMNQFRLLQGHFGYGAYRLFSKRPYYITMFRDPTKQLPSNFDQMGRDWISRHPKQKNKDTDLLKVITTFPRKRRLLSNNQTHHSTLDLDVLKMTNSMKKKRQNLISL